MKFKHLILPLVLLFSCLASAFEPPGADGLAKYSSRIDGVNGSGDLVRANELVYDMATDKAGNVYVVGSFDSPKLSLAVNKEVDLENPSGLLTTTFVESDLNLGNNDVFITKYDSSGNVVWVRTAGGTGNDYGTGVALDEDGNIYITGQFIGTAIFGATELIASDAYLDGNTSTPVVSGGMFVAMLDAGGSWQWARQLEYELNNYEKWEKTIYLNFEENSFTTPDGYFRHNDREFQAGSLGLSYGFHRRGDFNGPEAKTFSPLGPDPRLNSYVVFQKRVAQQSENINSRWELNGLSAGTYRVRIHGRQEVNTARFKVGGAQLGGLPLGEDAFRTFITPISNGQSIEVLPGGGIGDLEDSQLNELDFIEIEKATTQPRLFSRDVTGAIVINSGRNIEMGKAITVDKDRNIYVKGHLAGDSTIRSAMPESSNQFEYELRLKVGESYIPVAASGQRAQRSSFVAKLENNTVSGDPTPEDWSWQWVRPVSTEASGSDMDFPRVASESSIGALKTDDNGDLFLTGNWSSKLELGGQGEIQSTGSGREAFVARLNPAGDQISLGRISGGVDPLPVDLALDNQGSVFVTGNFTQYGSGGSGNLSFTNRQGTLSHSLIKEARREAFIAKMDVAGSWQWVNKVGTEGSTQSNDDVIAYGLGRDAAGSLYFTGAFVNGPLKFPPAVISIGKPNPNTVNPFIAKRSPASAGGWEGFVQSPAVFPESGGDTVAYHGVDVLSGPGGTMFWLVSTGSRRHATGNSDTVSDAVSGNDEVLSGANRAISDRLPLSNSSPDFSLGMAGFLFPINTDLEALPAFFVKSGFFAGEEIPPPSGVYLDAGGSPLQPEIIIGGDATADSSAFFYWDSFAKKLYAASETLQSVEIKWKVAADPANTDRITVETGVQWPNIADTDRYQQHITGGGESFDLPHVELQPAGLGFTFLRPLYSDSGSVFGNKIFKATSGWSTLLYQDGQNAAPGTSPARLVVVRSNYYNNSLEAENVPALIGTALDGTAFGHDSIDGRNGFVATERARIDATGVNAAYNRETRTGPIIPVNDDEPARDSETRLTVMWYDEDDANMGVPWPVKAVNYEPQWPADAEVIAITSALGSDVVVDDGAYHFEQEELISSKYTSPRIYEQSDKNLPGYNPNEEHAVIAQGQRRDSPAVFALRNDLNHLNPDDPTYRTSDPYTLLKYRDATDGLRWKFKVYRVELTHQYDPANIATLFDFNDFTGTAGNQVQPPWPLSNFGSSTLTSGEGSAYFEDVHGTVWARSDGLIDVYYFYPLQLGFWYDLDGNGQQDPDVSEVPWLDRVTTTVSASNGTPLAQPVRISYDISWPQTPPVLRIGDSFTEAKNGLPDVINHAATAIIFDENDPRVGHTDPVIAATADPRETLIRLFDSTSERKVPYPKVLAGLNLETSSGQTVEVELAEAGRYKIKFLPFDLKARLFFDPITKELGWKGADVNGGLVRLINIMSTKERDQLMAFDNGSGSDWDAAIEELYFLSRNPHGVDLNDDGQPDQRQPGEDHYAGIAEGPDNSLVFATLFEGKMVSAGLGKTTSVNPSGEGWVTLIENNVSADVSPAIFAQQVNVHVFRVEGPQVVGHVNVIQSDSVFDTGVTLRHSADFAGDPDQLNFQWFYKADQPGAPNNLGLPGIDPGWEQLNVGDELGANQISISDSGVRSISDGWIYVRYRGPASPWNTAFPDPSTVFSLAGNPATIGLPHRPQLLKGWIKRVVEGLNPFETRVKEFHSTPTQTYVSMIQQAGARYEGDIAFNGDPSNVNQVGLIELYDTLLRFGSRLSIDGTPSVNHPGANNALLLAATRLSDFYMLLGNEAFGDAQDPTVGFNVGGGQFGTSAGSVFAFQNQLPNLIEEELALLRGRSDEVDDVNGKPVFNRLFWNFTSGLEGEPAYVNNYNITDQDADGFVNEFDARTLFPQGHGDAWGHYLTATKSFYRLLRHPFYTREPRTEATTVADVPITVLYLAEKKFANAASARARTGAQIVSLEYRNRYTASPGGQFIGYKDTDTERAWGVDGWARRAGQGAILDWAMGNALLPEVSSNTTALEKIDRQNVRELQEIGASLEEIEAIIDDADQGLNPLGLTNNTVPFDINPSQVVTTSARGPLTHFEQIYDRAQKAVDNARSVYEFANQSTQRLRQLQLDANDFAQDSLEQELDFKNRLIEIFGYPYSGDIGPGQIYPTGYDGPDLIKYMYRGLTGISDEAVGEPGGQFTAFFKPMDVGEENGVKQYSRFFPEDAPDTPTTEASDSYGITFPIIQPEKKGASGWAFTATSEMGTRRASGRLQSHIGAAVSAEVEFKKASLDYENLIQKIIDAVELFEIRSQVRADQVEIREDLFDAKVGMRAAVVALKTGVRIGNGIKEFSGNVASMLKESFPSVVGFSTDPSSTARGAVFTQKLVVQGVASQINGILNGAIDVINATQASLSDRASLDIQELNYDYQVAQQLRSIEQLLRQEPAARLKVFQAEQKLKGSFGAYKRTLAEGQRLIEERLVYRRKVAADTQINRYQDITFRNFRNDALQKYQAAFDLAARYVYLAAQTYDYETNLKGSQTGAGRRFLEDIVRERALGQFIDGEPINGVNGLSDPMARMSQNFAVFKGQLGFNNPQVETGRFSLRKELFRITDGSNEEWARTLQNHRVADLWQVPEFRRYCRPFAPEGAGPQPGLVIPFDTNVNFGFNFFGWPLAGGDSSYDSSNFATKVRSVGVWFENYNGSGLAITPRVYLVPAGADVMRSPDDDTLSIREFSILDQRIPEPFPIGASDLTRNDWIPTNDSLSDEIGEIRRFNRFRAYHDSGFDVSQMTSDSRLIGRSVWNTRWVLIVPGGTFLNDPDNGLDTFIEGQTIPAGNGERDGNGIKDIKLFFETYAYPGL